MKCMFLVSLFLLTSMAVADPIIPPPPDLPTFESVPVVNHNITYSISPEFGVHFFNTGAFNMAPTAKNYVNTLKSLNWNNASETHVTNIDNFYVGVKGQVDIDDLTFGIGYRYFDLGNANVDVNANSNSSIYQWTHIYDEQWATSDSIYLSAGFCNYLKPRLKLNLNAEIGVTSAELHDTSKWDGYNGSNFSYYSNSSIHSAGYWYAILIETEYKFARSFFISSSIGYKINDFNVFKYDAADSNFYNYKVGDTAKDNNNKDFSLNLDGPICNVKMAWMF